MAIFDWIIVALFLVGLIMIGFIFSRRNKNIEDYFVAGRSMPTWVIRCTYFNALPGRCQWDVQRKYKMDYHLPKLIPF